MTAFTPPTLRQQLVAVLVALACGAAFLGPALRPDRVLLPYPPEFLQPMRQVADAVGSPPIDEIFRGNLSMGDKYNQSLAWDRITQDRLRRGELPLWTRDIGGGVPFVPQMGQVYHPFNLLLFFVPSTGVYGIWYLLHIGLMGFFAYRFMRRMQVGHGAAIFGMVAICVGFWLQARVHHNVMLSAALPVFAMLSCTHHLFVHGGRGGHMAMLALGTGLSWICGFAPASLMCTYLVCIFAVLLCVRDCPAGQRLASLVRFGVAMALGLLLASAHLGSVLLAAEVTSRNPAEIGQLEARAMELPHLLSAVWPTLLAWPADHFYLPEGRIHPSWASLALLGKQLKDAAFSFPETAFAIGLAPLCFLWPGLRSRWGWFFAAAAAFGIAMAMGWLLPWSAYLPGAHSGDLKRFLLLFGLAAPVCAAMGLDRCLRTGRTRLPLILLCIVCVHSVELFALHCSSPTTLQGVYGPMAESQVGMPAGTFGEWLKLQGHPDEGAVNRARLLTGFGVGGLAALLSILATWRVGRHTVPLLVLVTAGELLYLGHGTIVAVEPPRIVTPPGILRPILDAEETSGVRPRVQRLMPATNPDPLAIPVFPNLGAFWGIEDLGAYNPLPKRRMEELFLALEPDRPGKVSVALGGAGVSALRDPASLRHPLADLLGIEWVLAPAPVEVPGLEDATPAGTPGTTRLYRRAGAMPRATFVTAFEVLADKSARLARLTDREHDPRKTVLLERSPPETPAPAGPGAAATRVAIRSHTDAEVQVEVGGAAAGFLRLADPHDAGWTATIDGAATPIYIADHYFRAVFVGPGEHVVVFRYDGATVWGPQVLSVLGLVGIVVVLLLTRRRKTPTATP